MISEDDVRGFVEGRTSAITLIDNYGALYTSVYEKALNYLGYETYVEGNSVFAKGQGQTLGLSYEGEYFHEGVVSTMFHLIYNHVRKNCP